MPVHQLVLEKQKPNEDVIRKLKEWLHEAENGRIQGVCLVGMNASKDTRRAYCGEYEYPQLTHTLQLLVHDLIHEAIEQDKRVFTDLPEDGDEDE